MGFGFRVGKGVRVYPGGRGLGVSIGRGPVRYYTRIGGGRPSVAAHERQLRQAQRVEEIQSVINLDRQFFAMCQVHTEEFEPAAKPHASIPDPADPNAIKSRLEKEATAGISRFKFSERRDAKEKARANVAAAVETEQKRLDAKVQKEQDDLDAVWTLLQKNDSETVLAVLEGAFEDNDAPAAAVSCHDDRVDVVMRWPALGDLVPERKADVTPSGNPTIKKKTKTEQVEYYLEALCSNALATIKEAFTVCPGINEIGLAVVRLSDDPARGDGVVETLLIGTARRQDLTHLRWENIFPTAALLQNVEGKIGFKGRGATKALYGLALEDDEKDFVVELAKGLEVRVPDDGLPGVALPVKVLQS